MKSLPFYIARRYLISKKSHNIVNFISWISIAGVAVGTMALVTVLSVFNGFDSLIRNLINTFDSDLKITIAEGKIFTPDSVFNQIRKLPEVVFFTEVLEEQAILEFNKKQFIATIKGVGKEYQQMNGIDTMIVEGSYMLENNGRPYTVVGYWIAHILQISINFIQPIDIYVPRRDADINTNPENTYNHEKILCSGVFSIQNEFDEKYILVPVSFARQLLEYTKEVSAIELKISDSMSESEKKVIQKKIQKLLGDRFIVKNRYQQHELLYKIMKSEKWAIYLILTFILIVASFNNIGSLTMLIIDKKNDIAIMQSLGASKDSINHIFITEGWLISIAGALIGLLLGFLLCVIQIKIGIIDFPNSSIISKYPVEMRLIDFLAVLVTVLAIGYFAAWYPVRFLTKKYLIFE